MYVYVCAVRNARHEQVPSSDQTAAVTDSTAIVADACSPAAYSDSETETAIESLHGYVSSNDKDTCESEVLQSQSTVRELMSLVVSETYNVVDVPFLNSAATMLRDMLQSFRSRSAAVGRQQFPCHTRRNAAVRHTYSTDVPRRLKTVRSCSLKGQNKSIS